MNVTPRLPLPLLPSCVLRERAGKKEKERKDGGGCKKGKRGSPFSFVRSSLPPPRFSSPLRRVRGAKKTDSAAAVGRTLRQNLLSVNGGKHFAQSYLRPDSSPLPALNATFERGMRGREEKKSSKAFGGGIGGNFSPPFHPLFSFCEGLCAVSVAVEEYTFAPSGRTQR